MTDKKWSTPKITTIKNPGAKTPPPPKDDNKQGGESK